MDFPAKALLAVPAHGSHILTHTLPHETCSHHAFGGTYARVCHTVHGVEHGRSVRQWHQWPGNAICHIAQHAGPLYLDSPHCQGGGLKRARTASLVGHHPGAMPATGCMSATPAATPYLLHVLQVDRDLMVSFLKVNLAEHCAFRPPCWRSPACSAACYGTRLSCRKSLQGRQLPEGGGGQREED
jgi:hypothetical protein